MFKGNGGSLAALIGLLLWLVSVALVAAALGTVLWCGAFFMFAILHWPMPTWWVFAGLMLLPAMFAVKVKVSTNE